MAYSKLRFVGEESGKFKKGCIYMLRIEETTVTKRIIGLGKTKLLYVYGSKQLAPVASYRSWTDLSKEWVSAN